MVFYPASVYEPTARARQFLDTFLRAFRRHGLSAKEAAGLQGLSEAQWSLQARGQGAHASVPRLGDALLSNKDLLDQWIKEVLELRISECLDEAEARRIIDRIQVFVLELEMLARQLKKPMAKAILPPAAPERKLA